MDRSQINPRFNLECHGFYAAARWQTSIKTKIRTHYIQALQLSPNRIDNLLQIQG